MAANVGLDSDSRSIPANQHSDIDLVVDAVYEDGIIKPLVPLDLPSATHVKLHISPQSKHIAIDASAPIEDRQSSPAQIKQRTMRAWSDPPWLHDALARPLGRSGLLAAFTGLELVALLAGLLVYALTRFTGLSAFPVYFFCDEAIQTNLANMLLQNGLRDAEGTLLPPYFLNVEKWSLSLSVYVQMISTALFGVSVEVARATSALVSMLGVIAVALTLKLVFANRFWWLSALVMAAIPAWFLHSRTAFETVMMVSFYACFICAYLLYRYRSPYYLFAALLFGGATFYSYANGQGVMLVSGVLLLLIDLRYHLEQRRTIVIGALGLAWLLAVPFVRFRMIHPEALTDHLLVLHSYWIKPLSLSEKLLVFGQTYLQGLNPAYWFFPNDVDLVRHLMKGMGHAPLLSLPFVLIGLGVCLRKWRSPAHRIVLIAILAAPFSAALAEIAITRVLAMVVPLTLLTCIGLEQIARWVRRWTGYLPIAVGASLLFVLMSWNMLHTALVEGATWYSDYGIGGMQYGAEQLFGHALPEEMAKSPNDHFLVSPTWANNPNAFLDFFLTSEQSNRITLINIDAFTVTRQELTLNHVFVMPYYEYQQAQNSGKFILARPERIIPYPDGRPGFYFVRMQYVPYADELFAADRTRRQQLQENSVLVNGEVLLVRHSLLDMGQLTDLFDNAAHTLIRGFESNPLILEFNFATPRTISELDVTVGTMDFTLDVEVTPVGASAPQSFRATYLDLAPDPQVTYVLPDGPLTVTKLRLAIQNLRAQEVAHIHVREIAFR
ncbi:MAG: glycosyltransferase family 39 protein [Chloroflexales bacterium]|nr:glycosyltransferase family 39 protein [Chloroflexales bacterium]